VDFKFSTLGPNFQTLLRHLSQTVTTKKISYERVIHNALDGDITALDWLRRGNKNLAIIIPGLEGDSQSSYLRALIPTLLERGCDALVVNHRGCGGLVNNSLKGYHSGFTEDLKEILSSSSLLVYKEIFLIGFSVGGNIVLKALGELGEKIPSNLVKACAVSTPCNLEDAALRLNKGFSRIYQYNFINIMKSKLKRKLHLFTVKKDYSFKKIVSFYDFDSKFTAPFFNYKSAEDYWRSNSSIFFIPNIKLPTDIITAVDDPFFTEKSIPYAESKINKNINLCVTPYGGHVGFLSSNLSEQYYHEHLKKFLN
jgi:uncharacterized protein